MRLSDSKNVHGKANGKNITISAMDLIMGCQEIRVDARNARSDCTVASPSRYGGTVRWCTRHWNTMAACSSMLRGTCEVLAAVRQNGCIDNVLLRTDKELAAVGQTWRALQYASDEMRDDFDVGLACVKQNGRALMCAVSGSEGTLLAAAEQNVNNINST